MCQISPNFDLKKYEYKAVFMQKNGPRSQDFKWKISKFPDL